VIFFDTTKTGAAGHRSGLTRVSARLREELGKAAMAAGWERAAAAAGAGEWFLTAEPFSEAERPGFSAWLASRRCRTAAIFHDAIPLRHPRITWPRSVARHAGYLKLLAGFERVWAVSAASRDDLLGFWRWQGVASPPAVEVLPLGADFDGAPRGGGGGSAPGTPPRLLCVGIIEPRKNQAFLLEVAAALWREGLEFGLDFVGRVNPHFGRPIARRLAALSREFPGLRARGGAGDRELAGLYGSARASVFPTLAEGCGLPLLESLWRGVPCVCSDLPVLRENAARGGCLAAAAGDSGAWSSALRAVLTDEGLHARLAAEARARPLPTWSESARILARALTGA
jgi:glycosyltransferase involved in cell wall biosynthesis